MSNIPGPRLTEDTELREYEHMTHNFSVLVFNVLQATKYAFKEVGGSEKFRCYDIGAHIQVRFIPYQNFNDPVTCVLLRGPRIPRTTDGIEGVTFSAAYGNQSAKVQFTMWLDNLPEDAKLECELAMDFQAAAIRRVMAHLSRWANDDSFLVKTCRQNTAVSLLKSREGEVFANNGELIDFGNEHGFISDEEVKILSDALNLVRKQGYRV